MFDAAVAHVRALRGRGLNVIVAGWSDGSRERLSHVLGRARAQIARVRFVLPSGEDGARGRAAARRDRARTGVRSAGLRGSRRAGHSRRPARPPVEAQAPRAGCAGRSERAHRRRSRRPYRSRRRPLRRPEDDRGRGRAARLPRDPLCRRRPAVPAGRKSRAPVALRLGDRRTRQARRRGLAVAQGAPEEARARDGGRAHPRRRPAHDALGAAPDRPRRSLRRVLRPLSL